MSERNAIERMRATKAGVIQTEGDGMKPKNKFFRKDGLCTVYALACGHLNACTVGDDPQAVTMGADGAVYWVKSRIHRDPRPRREGQILWLTFPRNTDGYREALRTFRKLRRDARRAIVENDA